MTTAYLGIGSNQNRRHNIRAALQWLEYHYDSLHCSPVYESEPVGVACDRFYNLVVAVETEKTVLEMHTELRQLEHSLGRRRGPGNVSHSLDVDILLYGDLSGMIDGVELPRPEILNNAFVLRPLSQLAPELKHPQTGKTYQQLWKEYSEPQKLWLVDLPP
ncbi:2-amino-4-hydroxy-6-hydroxymethyldihydropteridine diphosphokinase [Porticoccus sp. GXU_MW_L64]